MAKSDKIIKFFRPLILLLIPGTYILLLKFGISPFVRYNYVLIPLFVPVIFLESVAQNIFKKKSIFPFIPRDLPGSLFLALRSFVWLLIFAAFIPHLPAYIYRHSSIDFLNTAILYNPLIVIISEVHIAALVFVVWLAIYYYVTVRSNRYRMLTTLVLPLVFFALLFFHNFFFGGIDDQKPSVIEETPGVKVLTFDMPRKDYTSEKIWDEELRYFPAGLQKGIDPDIVYALYSNPYGKSHLKKKPHIRRLDMKNRTSEYYNSYYTRSIYVGEAGVFLNSWMDRNLMIISHSDFPKTRKGSVISGLDNWQTGLVYCDDISNSVFITNDFTPQLAKIDLSSGMTAAVVDIDMTKYGGSLWDMKYSAVTGRIYLIALKSSDDLLELDPETLEITKRLDLGIYGASSIAVDDSRGLIYLQDAESFRIYKINLRDFSVKQILRGEECAMDMVVDAERNRLYTLSHLYGAMIVIDDITGRQLQRVKVGAKPKGLLIQGDTAYINSRTGIVRVDLNELPD